MNKEECIKLGYKPKKHCNERRIDCPAMEKTSYEYDEWDCVFGSFCEDCYLRLTDVNKQLEKEIKSEVEFWEGVARVEGFFR